MAKRKRRRKGRIKCACKENTKKQNQIVLNQKKQKVLMQHAKPANTKKNAHTQDKQAKPRAPGAVKIKCFFDC